MIPYDVDPSLHNAEPEPPRLGDGFSPPPPEPAAGGAGAPQPAAGAEALGDKSPF